MKRANLDNIRKTVEKLAVHIGPRPIKRRDRLAKARTFIAESFRGFGMSVALQPVIYMGI